jgi:hypothetical protein
MVLVSNKDDRVKPDKDCHDLNVDGYGPHPSQGVPGPSPLTPHPSLLISHLSCRMPRRLLAFAACFCCCWWRRRLWRATGMMTVVGGGGRWWEGCRQGHFGATARGHVRQQEHLRGSGS